MKDRPPPKKNTVQNDRGGSLISPSSPHRFILLHVCLQTCMHTSHTKREGGRKGGAEKQTCQGILSFLLALSELVTSWKESQKTWRGEVTSPEGFKEQWVESVVAGEPPAGQLGLRPAEKQRIYVCIKAERWKHQAGLGSPDWLLRA